MSVEQLTALFASLGISCQQRAQDDLRVSALEQSGSTWIYAKQATPDLMLQILPNRRHFGYKDGVYFWRHYLCSSGVEWHGQRGMSTQEDVPIEAAEWWAALRSDVLQSVETH